MKRAHVGTRTGRRLAALGSLAGVLLLLAAAVAAPAKAAPGDLDLTFSGDGRQTTDFRSGTSEAAAAVRQPDGKIVVVGTNHSAELNDGFALARYNADGSLDTSFSGDGRQATEFGDVGGANGVALQADGKIVVVGVGGTGDFVLARYNANGSLDTSFSSDGKQMTDLGGMFNGDGANGVAIQADGKIVAVGVAGAVTPTGASDDFGLARYNTNGSLDTSFSGDGKTRTHFAGVDAARGVAIQADGKIVAVGTSRFGTFDADFALSRYNTDGSLDTSFSADGKQRTDFGGIDQDVGHGVALQADGKIVAVGGTADGDFGLARYNTNGSLDTSFSGDGKETTDFVGGFERSNGVAIQGDGKIVAVGFAGATTATRDFALARYNADGSLDASFSGDGRETTDFADADEANGMALQPDGKIVAVGAAGGVDSFGTNGDLALARYNADGSLDTSFSGDGKQTTGLGGSDFATGVAIQGDGKVVAVGFAHEFGSAEGFALARYNADGSLDTSFSGDGRQTTVFAGSGAANEVAIQADGKIVVVGSAPGGFALARYNTNGSLDTSLSGDGKQTTGFAGAAHGAAIQADGKIVAVGDSGGNFALARYNPNGSLDTSFSGDGRQTTDFGSPSDRAADVAVRADGKIVAAGEGGGGMALARYNPIGTLDTTFSGDGKQTLAGFSSTSGVVLQTTGRIIAAGVAFGGPTGDDFGLARFNANGTPDTSFSGDGKLRTDFGTCCDGAFGVALPGNGKILAVGSADALGGSNFALARYNSNGSLDPSFSGDGRQATNFGGLDGASDVAIQGDGRIVAVGVGRGAELTRDFALARYLGG